MNYDINIKNYWKDIDRRLVRLINEGYCYLPPINELLDNSEYFKIIHKETINNTYNENNQTHKNLLKKYGFYDILLPKLYNLARKEYFYNGRIDDQYHIVRNVISNQKSESYRGHFDSHIFTMILPMYIPKNNNGEVRGGDLVFFPNFRNTPKLEIINILQKIFYKKFNSQKGFEKLAEKKNKLVENFSDYRPLIFLGIKTLHGNKELFEDKRQTLLSHFFDPSPKWGIGNLLRNIRNR